MAEAKLSFKKRKRPSCSNHPFLGIYTRSKSQIYLHRNRSGRSRSDSIRHGNHRTDLHHFHLLTKKPRRSLAQDSCDIDDFSCISIKDLRARRVFSPASCDLGGENGDAKRSDREIESFANGFSCDGQKLEVGDPNFFSDKDGLVAHCLDDEKVREDADIEGFDRGLPRKDQNLDEERLQTTPPDAEILGGNKMEFVSHNMEHFSRKPLNEKVQKNSTLIGAINDSNSKAKSVVSPCFRVKLFKTPGSFSYRRLLPYLMDITKDSSCGPKFEKSLEENPIQPLLSCQEISVHKSKTNSCPAEVHIGDSGNESNSASVEQDSKMPFDSHKDLCTRDRFPTSNVDENCTKMLVTCKNQNLNNSNPDLSLIMEDSHLNKNDPTVVYSDVTKRMDYGETEKTDNGCSCITQNVNNLNHNLPLNIEKCHSGKDDEVGQYFDKLKQSDSGGMKKVNIGCPTQDSNHINSTLYDTEVKRCDGEHRVDDDGKVVDQIDDSNEECRPMSSLGVNIFHKPEGDDGGGNRVECVLQSMDHVFEKPSEGHIPISNSCVVDKRIDSTSKSKLVLNPCSRLKLFKTPGSFSYRRMLPFLKDIAKDNSYASENGHFLKLGKSLKEKPLSPEEKHHSLSAVSDCQEIPTENSTGNSCHMEHYTGDSSTPPTTAISIASDDKEPELTCPENVIEFPMPFNSQQEQVVQAEPSTSESADGKLEIVPDKKLEIATNIMDTIHGNGLPSTSLCSSVSSGSLSREEDAPFLSVNTEEDCINSIIKYTNRTMPIEEDSLHQGSSQLEARVNSQIHAICSTKGILKRNPRGCRGLCTCLNCSSFRLHAERAFEFSRNQMQDAEEVALDLIEELSHLRNMFEKSGCGAENHDVVRVKQVKEACRKASKAEELAKDRLSQMNCDLNIHCRITCGHRPRVRFANYVEEKVIPKGDLLNN